MIPPYSFREVCVSEPTPVSLRPHHSYKSWSTDWYDEQGHRRTKRFGKQGDVSEREAQSKFRNWYQNEWKAKPFVRNPDDPSLFTVAMMATAYKAAAKVIYQKNGKPTDHLNQVNWAMASLANTFGVLPAASLDNPRIANLRDAMIFDAEGTPRAVKTVNGRLLCIKQAMKWARERNLVTAEALADVLAVTPLKAGRCAALPSKPVKPVAESVVDRTKAKLPPTVAAMVDLQWLTGMRPGEVCIIRTCDIDRQTHKKNDVWIYTPHTHKTEEKGMSRRVVLGRKAQKILAPYLIADLTAYIFTPAQAQAERRAVRTTARLTPLSCGNGVGTNLKRGPKRKPGKVYTNQSYRKAIRHACRAVQKEDATFPTWHPNQIRHSWATRTRRDFGYEAASDGLGHNALSTTAIYAELSLERQIAVAKKAG